MPLTPFQAAAGALVTAVAALQAPPSRQYVAVAEPPHECEQVTAHVASITRVASSIDQAPLQGMPSASMDEATIIVQVVRCYDSAEPRGRPPASSKLQGQAQTLADDAWRLWRALGGRWLADDCRPRIVGPATPIAEGGGFAGWSVQVVVNVDGA